MTFILTGYVCCSLLSLLIVKSSLHFWKGKKQFTVYGSIIGSFSMVSLVFGIKEENTVLAVIGIALYSIFTFPSLTILIQMIGKRAGSDFDLVATANTFVFGTFVACLLLGLNQLLRYLVESKLASLIMCGTIGILTGINVFLIICGIALFNTKFKKP